MTDNVTAPGAGTVFATDFNAGESAHWPISKVAWGTRDSAYNIVDLTHGLPVQPGTGTSWSVVDTAAEASLAAIQASVAGTLAVSAASLPLPTGAATAVAQGSTTAGQVGSLTQAAVLSAAPTYTTGQTAPLTMNASGCLRTSLFGLSGQAAVVTGPIDGFTSNNGLYTFSTAAIFNGTSHDRARSVAGAAATTGTGIAAVAGLLFDGTNYQVPRGAASLGDAVNNPGMTPANGFIYNGASWDRVRSATADPAGTVTTGKIGVVAYEGTTSAFNLTAATAVKATAGRIFKVSVLVAGAAGTINDCATTGAAAVGNQIAVIPAAIGVYDFNWPMATGIVVVPGAGQTVAVSYQ